MMTTFDKRRTRPLAGLPDFSAMSALGLMLINFFMVQQMWEKPQVMPLVVPSHDDECIDCDWIKEEKVLTLLCAREKIYTYSGITDPVLDSVDYSPTGLRKLILDEERRLEIRFGLEDYTEYKSGLTKKGSFINVLIKALPSATYGNVVNVLDEMRICRVRYFLLEDCQPNETAFVKDPAEGLIFTPY